MQKVSNRPVSLQRLASLLIFVLCLCLAVFALAAHAADEATADPSPEQTAARTKALARAHAAVVGVEATAVDDAGSIATLGRERHGSGVVIGHDGLVLTIGYLILEADHVDLQLGPEHVVPARVVGYDLATGFGLLQALAPLAPEPVPLGHSAAVRADEPLLIVSGGDDAALGLARMVSQRPFSGYWEYHIDGALFTAPPQPGHSGAALFNVDGELLGIGSLRVSDALGKGRPPLAGNMFVPVDLLKPILAEIRERGASRSSSRAWLGVNCVEYEGQIRVVRLSTASPAEDAGLEPGDRIVAIDGVAVNDLESFYKTLWQRSPERDVSLDIQRGGVARSLRLHSLDRMKTLRTPRGV